MNLSKPVYTATAKGSVAAVDYTSRTKLSPSSICEASLLPSWRRFPQERWLSRLMSSLLFQALYAGPFEISVGCPTISPPMVNSCLPTESGQSFPTGIDRACLLQTLCGCAFTQASPLFCIIDTITTCYTWYDTLESYSVNNEFDCVHYSIVLLLSTSDTLCNKSV